MEERMHPSRIFLFIAVGFLGGIFFREFVSFAQSYLLVFLAVALGTVFSFFPKKYLTAVFLSLIFFSAGFFWTNHFFEKAGHTELAGKLLQKEMSLVLDVTEKSQYKEVIVFQKTLKQKILVRVPLHAEYAYGDAVLLSCELQKPKKFDDFDYPMYLAAKGVYYICEKSKAEKIAEKEGNIFLQPLLGALNDITKQLRKKIPEPEASLVIGILLGGNQGFSDQMKEAFSRTGLTHIVAVSGYNVTIIVQYLILVGIFIGLWRKQAIVFAVVGIFIFIALIGFSASAVRAALMGGLLLWAMHAGRIAYGYNALIAAASVMLAFNPLLLRYDIGFQLSFLATLGIVSLSPLWQPKIKDARGKFFLEIILLSLSAQIFVLPVILFQFQTLSLISLLANVLILPVVPIAMFLGFVAIPFSYIPYLGTPLLWIAYLPLKYIIAVVAILSEISWASMEVSISNITTWLWIVGAFALLFYLNKKKIYAQ